MDYPSLLKLLKDFKKDVVCSVCNAFEPNAKCFNSCGHICCTSCLEKNSYNCIVCSELTFTNSAEEYNLLEQLLPNTSTLVELLSALENPNLSTSNFKFLFTRESSSDKQNHKGETRLHIECRLGKINKVEELIKSGADVNVRDFAGWTPLHEAVLSQQTEIVRLLLNYGAFVDAVGPKYLTPLHNAIQVNNLEIIKLLVEYGASIISYNINGKTPLDLSHNNENLKIILHFIQPHRQLCKVFTIPSPKVFFIDIDDETINKFIKIPGTSISKKKNLFELGDVKYIVLGIKIPKTKYILAGILQGACIVTVYWVNELIANNYLPNPLNFLMHLHGYEIEKAALNAFHQLPKLFDGLNFYFYPSNGYKIGGNEYSTQDLKQLVQLGGGKIIMRPPKDNEEYNVYYPYHANKISDLATTTHYLIYNDGQDIKRMYNLTKIKHRSARWLIECMSNFVIFN